MANVYELLELAIDPRPQFKNLDEVKAAIETKKRKLHQRAGNRAGNSVYMQKIKELNLIAENLTMEVLDNAYEEAKSDLKQSIQSELLYVVINGKISENHAERIAKAHKVSLEFILREFPDITLDKKETKRLLIPECKVKVSSNMVKEQLLVVNKENLYDFLNYHGTKDTLAKIKKESPERLQNIAKELAGEFDRNLDLAIKSAGTKLAALCQAIFVDERSKKDYDYYLTAYGPLFPILNRVTVLEEDGILHPQTGELLVEDINKITGNEEESRCYLRGKCEELNIVWTEMGTSFSTKSEEAKETTEDRKTASHAGKKAETNNSKTTSNTEKNDDLCTREQIIKAINATEKVESTWRFITVMENDAKKVKNAIKSYAKNVQIQDVIGLMDCTLFGSAKDGFLITQNAMYSSYFRENQMIEFNRLTGFQQGRKDFYLDIIYKDGTKQEFVIYSSSKISVQTFLEVLLELK